MASTTVTEQYDKSAATEDWRVGLVELPPDHVYGATALSAEEWAALDRRPHGEFFLVERTAHLHEEVCGVLFASRSAAYDHLHHAIELTPAAFGPFGPFRLVVREAER